MSFIPRQKFIFPSTTPSWYAGHMVRSLRLLPALLEDIDLVIEARDARLPLTSVNGAFDRVLERVWGLGNRDSGGRSGIIGALSGERGVMGRGGTGGGLWRDMTGRGRGKLVVYTKRDLADPKYEEPLKKAFMDQLSQKVLFADTRSDKDAREILRYAVKMAKDNAETMPEMKILVVGMPNVGKSSLLNALRRVGVHKGKAFRTGAEAGITRKLTGTVKIHENPSIYVYDTPGVMVPFLGKGEVGAERGLKLALTAGIKESLFEQDTICDYLLFRMNQRLAAEQHLHHDDPRRNPTYLDLLPLPPRYTTPTTHLHNLLQALAERTGALKKGGERDEEQASGYLLKAFREGRLGRWTLDFEGVDGFSGSTGNGGITEGQGEMGLDEEHLDLGNRDWSKGRGRHGHEEGNQDQIKKLFSLLSDSVTEQNRTRMPLIDRQENQNHTLSNVNNDSQTKSSTTNTPLPTSTSTSDLHPPSPKSPDSPLPSVQTEIESTQTQSLPPPPSNQTLQALVSSHLRIHLLSTQRDIENSEKGLNLSSNQEKKILAKKKLEVRREKWVEGGVDVVSPGGGVRKVGGRKGKESRYGKFVPGRK